MIYLRRLKRVLFRRSRPDSQPWQTLVAMGDGSIPLPGFAIDIRYGANANRIRVGANSMLACAITLERNIGSVEIGNDTYIGNSQIICACQVVIGSDVLIAWGCTIVDHDSHSLNWVERAQDVKRWREGIIQGGLAGAATLKDWSVVPMAPIRIRDKVWIGFNVTILKGVTIGEGAVIAAESVITKDVLPYTLVAGNPARLIRELTMPTER